MTLATFMRDPRPHTLAASSTNITRHMTTAIGCGEASAALIQVCPEIRELDINPLKVLQAGVIAIDARVRVERIVPNRPSRRVDY